LESGLSEPGPKSQDDVEEKEQRNGKACLAQLGHYEVVEEIARGGMGVVYRARDLTLNRVVALKLMLAGQFAGEREVKRFRAEAEAAARLHHPNIVAIYEFGELEGRPFLSMRFVDGANLTERLHGTPMDAIPAAKLMSTLARSVHYAHQRSVLHRDLKPANVLLDSAGQPYVTDFGLAKCLDSADRLTLSGAAIGSPNYMSPEQASGRPERLTTAADVYSLGAIMYEVLTGRPPFRADTPLETMRKVMEEPPVAPRELYKFADRDLETICLKCMEKEPERRYGSAEALAEDLERWLRKEPIRTRPVTVAERVVKWMRRNPKLATLVVLLHVLFAAALVTGIWMSNRIAAARNEAEKANFRLAKDLRGLQWQKLEELASAGKRPDALAYLSRFLRDDPKDEVAATRVISMLSERNFVLPSSKPLEHDGPVNSAVFSADGQEVATASNDGTARVWDARNGQMLARFNHTAPVRSAEFLGKTHRVLSVCDDGYARMWREDTTQVFTVKVGTSEPGSATVSADGKWLAAATETNTVRIFNAANGEVTGNRIPINDSRPLLVFSPDSRQLAVRVHSSKLELRNVPSGDQAFGPIAPGAEIILTAFSPDGHWVFLGCSGGRGFVFDTQSGTLVKELPSQKTDVLGAEFSSDGQRLASIAWSEPVRIWTTSNWEPACPLFDTANMHVGFRLAGDGKRLVTFFQSGEARLRDTSTGKLLAEPFEHDGPIVGASFSPDGGQLVSASQDGTAQLWTTGMRQPHGRTLKEPWYMWHAEPSPDGRLIVVTQENSAQLLDSHTGEPVGKPMDHHGTVYIARFSADGKRVVTGSHDTTARVWSVPDGEPVTPELIHEKRVMHVVFSSDNQSVLTASDDRTARLWSAATGKLIFSLANDSELTDAEFAADGEKIVTATAQGTISIWSGRTGQLLHGLLRHKGVVWTARFNHDGSRLLSASYDKSARIWDVVSGKLLQSFQHPQGVLGAVFDPGEKLVLTGSLDGMARIWNIATGELNAQPMHHSEKISFAYFSPDGRRVLTGSEDTKTRLWDALTGYPLTEPFVHEGTVRNVQFSADGQQFFSASDFGQIRLCDNPKRPPAAPLWFCELIEALAGRHLNERGAIEPVSHEKLQGLRDRVSSSTENDFYSRWARWFFVERLKEPTPEFKP
jgi:WD40 repeat protein